MTAPDDARLKPTLQVAERIAGAAADLLVAGRYPADEKTKVLAMLACTITDGLVAVIALLRSHGQCHADTVVRSMLEALGDMHHLCADGRYLDRLKLASARKTKNAAEDFIRLRAHDPDCADLVRDQTARAQRAKQTAAEMEARGVKGIRVGERVAAPGLPAEFSSIYAANCFDAHHDIVALARRHFRGDDIMLGDTLPLVAALRPLAEAALIVACMTGKVREFAHHDAKVAEDAIAFTATQAKHINQMWTIANAPLREQLKEDLAASASRT